MGGVFSGDPAAHRNAIIAEYEGPSSAVGRLITLLAANRRQFVSVIVPNYTIAHQPHDASYV